MLPGTDPNLSISKIGQYRLSNDDVKIKHRDIYNRPDSTKSKLIQSLVDCISRSLCLHLLQNKTLSVISGFFLLQFTHLPIFFFIFLLMISLLLL